MRGHQPTVTIACPPNAHLRTAPPAAPAVDRPRRQNLVVNSFVFPPYIPPRPRSISFRPAVLPCAFPFTPPYPAPTPHPAPPSLSPAPLALPPTPSHPISPRVILSPLPGAYGAGPYLLSKTLCDLLPMRILPSLLCAAIVYPMAGLRSADEEGPRAAALFAAVRPHASYTSNPLALLPRRFSTSHQSTRPPPGFPPSLFPDLFFYTPLLPHPIERVPAFPKLTASHPQPPPPPCPPTPVASSHTVHPAPPPISSYSRAHKHAFQYPTIPPRGLVPVTSTNLSIAHACSPTPTTPPPPRPALTGAHPV